MSEIRSLLVVLGLATITACAARQGAVVMKVSDTEAHVSLVAPTVTVGSRVQLSRDVCVSAYGKRYPCHKHAIAFGTITELLGTRYARVTLPAGTHYEEGDLAEPIR